MTRIPRAGYKTSSVPDTSTLLKRWPEFLRRVSKSVFRLGQPRTTGLKQALGGAFDAPVIMSASKLPRVQPPPHHLPGFPFWRFPPPRPCYNFALPMAIISPFQAWRYAPERAPLAQVVNQPYDKITPEMQKRYYQASPFNLVHIILGQRQPADGLEDNVYTRASSSFREWRSTGILRQDAQPSLYRYLQKFSVPGS